MQYTRKAIFVAVLMVVVLVASVIAWEYYEVDFENYIIDAHEYLEGVSDEEVWGFIGEGMNNLPPEEQEALEGFSDEEIMDVARGTPAGLDLMYSMSSEEYTATENLLNDIIENNFEYSTGLWGPTGPVCPKRPTGTCESSSRRCIQRGGVACTYVCSFGGSYGPGIQCASRVCNPAGTSCGMRLTCVGTQFGDGGKGINGDEPYLCVADDTAQI